MTKMKSKKMTKSTFAIIIMAIAMVAMLAFGGTYAYFTATASKKTGTITTGTVKLTGGELTTIATTENVLPGDAVLSADITYSVATTDSEGNYVAIRVTLDPTVENVTVADLKISTDLLGWICTTPDATDGVMIYVWAGTTTTGTDPDTVTTTNAAPSAVTDNGTAVIGATDMVMSTEVYDNWVEDDEDGQNYAGENGLMGIEIGITIEARSIQASNLEGDAATAAAIATYLFETNEYPAAE